MNNHNPTAMKKPMTHSLMVGWLGEIVCVCSLSLLILTSPHSRPSIPQAEPEPALAESPFDLERTLVSFVKMRAV